MADGSSVQFLLGIDGGGSKTEFLLTDTDKNEINRLIFGNSNPINSGIENTKTVLENGIQKICNGKDYNKISVFAGIAGLKSGDNESLINLFLSRFGFASFACGSDIELALEIALKGGNGTAIIMGTGIVAYARCAGELHRTGGRGYLIDKGGSGFCFGSDALNAAFEFIDGRGGSETICTLIEQKLGKSLEASVSEIYKGGAAYVASFAPVVFEAFKLGDVKAREIIDCNAYEAAKIINASRNKLQNHADRIVICGGLCNQKEILRPFIEKYVEGKASITFLDEPIINGAVSLAKSNIRL